MTYFDDQYDETQEIKSPTKHNWFNVRIKETEEKVENMGLSFDGPDYKGQEEAYVRCISNRLRYLLEDPYFHMDENECFICGTTKDLIYSNPNEAYICHRCEHIEENAYDLADEAAAQE